GRRGEHGEQEAAKRVDHVGRPPYEGHRVTRSYAARLAASRCHRVWERRRMSSASASGKRRDGSSAASTQSISWPCRGWGAPRIAHRQKRTCTVFSGSRQSTVQSTAPTTAAPDRAPER